jgi:DNA-binding NarL/FixJ family response regulator
MTGKEIAAKLFLSQQTVKNSVHRILDKVGVGGCLGEIEAYQPSRWVCSSAENTVTKKTSTQLCFGALRRRVPCLIDGRNARVYRGLQ